MKHTPGPWFVTRGKATTGESFHIRTEYYPQNTLIYKNSRGHHATFHDAKLMAAAPELLVAVKAFIESGKGRIDKENFLRFIDAYALAIDAVTKAEDES